MELSQIIDRQKAQLKSKVSDLSKRIEREDDVLVKLDMIQQRIDIENEITEME